MTAPESRCPRAMTDYRRARPVYETYASLDADRETGPFLHADFTDHPFWMVTRYDHVLEALQLPEVFGNEVINPMDPNMSVELLPNKLNPPEHTKLRRVLNRWFAPAAVRRLEPLMIERCAALIGQLRPAGQCDLVSDFAIRVPTEMFLAILGLPIEDGGHSSSGSRRFSMASSASMSRVPRQRAQRSTPTSTKRRRRGSAARATRTRTFSPACW